MALYFYQAYSREGKRITGYIDAATTQAAKEQLAKTGVYPTKIELSETKTKQLPFYRKLFGRGISLRDKIFFTKQLSVLLKSGVPLLQALDLLIDQTEKKLKNIVISLRDNIKEGKSLADGLQKFAGDFDSIYIQLVRAGEATGKLEVILDRLTEYLERREEIKKTISAALRYPIIQLVIIVIITFGLLYFVVPQIVEVLSDMGQKLPLPTRILTSISYFVTSYYLFIIIFIIAIYAGYRLFKSTKQGAYTIDKLKLKLPIVGYFAKKGAIIQFSRTLGMLVEGGVNLAESLSIVVKIVDNKILSDALQKAKENIIKQGKIAHYLKETGIFPPLAIYLINTGEQSGELGPMLLQVSKYLEADVKEKADNLSTLLNPIMLGIMAGTVGFIILSIMLPIINMTNMASQATETAGQLTQ